MGKRLRDPAGDHHNHNDVEHCSGTGHLDDNRGNHHDSGVHHGYDSYVYAIRHTRLKIVKVD